VIVSSLSHALVGFYGALSAMGVDPTVIPTLSLTVGEDMLRTLEPEEAAGSFAAWPYFQSIESARNRAFIGAFQDRYGKHRRTDDYIVNAYVAVELWVAAAQAASTTDATRVAEALRGMRHNSPAGTVWVDETNQHLWRDVRIGQIQPDGQFEIVWTSELPIRPVTYPASRTRREWNELIGELR
jgi:urea transport system substrate-binding protein